MCDFTMFYLIVYCSLPNSLLKFGRDSTLDTRVFFIFKRGWAWVAHERIACPLVSINYETVLRSKKLTAHTFR